MITGTNWSEAKAKLAGRISTDEQRIVDLLAAGKSTPDIARALGTNRSAIWRRVQKIRQLLS
jgi:DNA-binding NarL/FixJ family response regulator